MRKYFFLLFIYIIFLTGCDKSDLVWDLPRTNTLDTLKNENINDPKYPIARFISSSTSIPLGSSISFVSTSTQNPTSYNWTFPGGTPTTSIQNSPTITYNNIGKYEVRLMVSNNYGSDVIVKPNYIEVYYFKSFKNQVLEGWSNNGWSFANTPTCLGCIYAWQNSSSNPIAYTISRSFSNIPTNSTLEFYYKINSPGGTLRAKINGATVWNISGFGSNKISIQLPNLSNFNLAFEALVGNTQSIYLNDIKIKP